MYTISQLAKKCSLSRSTVLYYEKVGLLDGAKRGGNGYRYYDGKALERLMRVVELRRTGIALEQIKAILSRRKSKCSAALQERLAAINEEMSALRAQQKVILEMLGPEGLSADTHVVTREQWVSFLRIAGLDEEGMRRWHIAFESSSPKAHKDFLESLGLDSDEIRRIRLWKR
jgi:DNA-binding transcriptional MerR regulator